MRIEVKPGGFIFSGSVSIQLDASEVSTLLLIVKYAREKAMEWESDPAREAIEQMAIELQENLRGTLENGN